MSGETTLGIAALIIALAVSYFLIKKSGLMTCKMDNSDQQTGE